MPSLVQRIGLSVLTRRRSSARLRAAKKKEHSSQSASPSSPVSILEFPNQESLNHHTNANDLADVASAPSTETLVAAREPPTLLVEEESGADLSIVAEKLENVSSNDIRIVQRENQASKNSPRSTNISHVHVSDQNHHVENPDGTKSSEIAVDGIEAEGTTNENDYPVIEASSLLVGASVVNSPSETDNEDKQPKDASACDASSPTRVQEENMQSSDRTEDGVMLHPMNDTVIQTDSNLPHNEPSQVPGYLESMIGKRVQVKDSLKDSTKRNQVGTVIRWKNKSTVEIKCDTNGNVFGVRLTSIDFVRSRCVSTNEFSVSKPALETTAALKPIVGVSDVPQSPIEREAIKEVSNNQVSPRSRVNMSDQQVDHIEKRAVDQSPQSEPEEENEPTEPYYKFPSQVPSRCGSIIGKRVKVKDCIKDRKKRNATGSVVHWKNKSTVEIQCDNGSKFGVKVSSIEFLHGPRSNLQEDDVKHESVSTKKPTLTRTFQRVTRSIREKASSPKASSSKPLSKTRRSNRSVRSMPTFDSSASNVGESWQVPNSSNDRRKFFNFVEEKIRLRNANESVQTEITFLGHLLKNRTQTVEIELNGRKNQASFDKQGVNHHDGRSYELVSCKCRNDDQSFGTYNKKQVASLVYAVTDGPGLDPFSVSDHLLRIGDFSTLKPRKIAARLELLQSPSSLNIVFLEQSHFQDIPDLGHVGGGFIHEKMLLDVLLQSGMKRAAADDAVAIQVRLLIPSMGLYKGMLMKKRILNGAPIELPCSMQKVLKSTHPNALPGAAILICKHKIHPSKGSANEYIGRKLDPSRKDPPTKSFKQKIEKPLSEMILRLWRTMGVPEELCKEYKKESLTVDRRNHAWLVGVPDPTNSLPLDTIFVPGMKLPGCSEVFVTRCPCYAHEHGRKFEVMTTKPSTISSEDWDWLNMLKFGVVIFSNPREGMKSIPERIANGDLDGDLYLVCWDKAVVESMVALPLQDEIADDDGKLDTGPSNLNWFDEAQDIITDAGLSNEIGHLTGKLYRLGEKAADESESKLKDPDANAYFEAYNQALEFKKHGRPISLPNHLIETIPESLRHLVEAGVEL